MATTVRSRIEMRLNRVPMSMRNVKMGDLLQKCIDQEQQRAARSTALMKPPTIRRGTSPTKQTRPAALGLKPPPQPNKRMRYVPESSHKEPQTNKASVMPFQETRRMTWSTTKMPRRGFGQTQTRLMFGPGKFYHQLHPTRVWQTNHDRHHLQNPVLHDQLRR
jgi:hypothetical protein